MLFLNTLEWQKDLKEDKAKLEDSVNLRNQLKMLAQKETKGTLLIKGREMLFDAYMELESYAFSASSISRVFDYRQGLEESNPELHKDAQGERFLEFLFTIDKLWQHTQAAVSELVKAGKGQLEIHNGKALYREFRANTVASPDLFSETKALVDSYLHVEVLVSLMDMELAEHKRVDAVLLDMAIEELRAFAGRGLRFGFWSLEPDDEVPMLADIDVDSYVLPL